MLDIVRLNDDKINKVKKLSNQKVLRRNKVTAIKKESRNDAKEEKSFKKKLVEVSAIKNDKNDSQYEKINHQEINNGVIVDSSLNMKLIQNNVINKLVYDKIVNNPEIRKYINFDEQLTKIEIEAEKIDEETLEKVNNDNNSINQEYTEDTILNDNIEKKNEENYIIIEDREDSTKKYKVDQRTKDILDILYKIKQNYLDKISEVREMSIIRNEKKERIKEINIDIMLIETQIQKLLMDKLI